MSLLNSFQGRTFRPKRNLKKRDLFISSGSKATKTGNALEKFVRINSGGRVTFRRFDRERHVHPSFVRIAGGAL